MSSRFFRRLTTALFWTAYYFYSLIGRVIGWFWNRNIPGHLALLLTLVLSSVASGATPRKAWSVPEMIDNDHTGGSGPNTWQVVFDARGDGIVVTGDYDRVWANRYTAGTGWGEPQIIDDTAFPAEDTRYGITASKNGTYGSPSIRPAAPWRCGSSRNRLGPIATRPNANVLGSKRPNVLGSGLAFCSLPR